MKKLTLILLAVTLTIGLNSCALMTNKTVKQACNKSPYVYTDLNSHSKKTIYHLPDGTACPSSHQGFFG